MGAFKNILCSIETTADAMIRKETGERRFFGDYHWHDGIAGAYISAIVETASGVFCVQYWKRRNAVQLSRECGGFFSPVSIVNLGAE